jgi:hypothetical protein
MSAAKSPISACRYCRFYQPEGLHRGKCDRLNASVESDWEACSLSSPAFTPNWDSVEELVLNWPVREDIVAFAQAE